LISPVHSNPSYPTPIIYQVQSTTDIGAYDFECAIVRYGDIITDELVFAVVTAAEYGGKPGTYRWNANGLYSLPK
jgi:hypothetical protein